MKGVLKALLFTAMMAVVSSGQLVTCKSKINYKAQKLAFEYDLTSIYHSPVTFDSLNYYSSATYNTYTMNICGESASTCTTDKPSSVCGFVSTGGIVGMGLTETQEFHAIDNDDVMPGRGVAVKYSGGTACSSGKARTSTVEVRCNEDSSSYIYDAVEDSADACDVTFYIYSKAGCGTPAKYGSDGGGIGAGGIILIILVCLVVVYFAGGAVYQWKFKDAQTAPEFIIHREFWFSIPGLVKDGVLFIAHGFKKGDYVVV